MLSCAQFTGLCHPERSEGYFVPTSPGVASAETGRPVVALSSRDSRHHSRARRISSCVTGRSMPCSVGSRSV